MKATCSVSSLFAWVLLLVVAHARQVQAQDLTKEVGLWVFSTNTWQPTNDGGECGEVEAGRIHTKMRTAVFGSRRELHEERELQSCRLLCKGFPIGQCHLVYWWCTGYRRELGGGGEEDDEGTENVRNEDQLETPNLRGRELQQTRPPTLLSNGFWDIYNHPNPAAAEVCATETNRVRTALAELEASPYTSKKCSRLISQYKVGCVNMTL